MSLFLILIIFAIVIIYLAKYSRFFITDYFENYKPSTKKIVNPYKIPNLKNKKTFNYNKLEEKYYNLKEDCYWNNVCELPPNNHNFFKYANKKTKTPSLLSCEISCDKLINCKPNQFEGCFNNKKCSCNNNEHLRKANVLKNCIEPFVSIAMSAEEGSNVVKFNTCREGYAPDSTGCKQICRGCIVGKCENGVCHT